MEIWVVVQSKSEGNVLGLVEKPHYKDAPSNLASIGRYILTADIFNILKELPKGLGGEIQLADAINIQAQRGSVDSVILKGTRFDCGSIDVLLLPLIMNISRPTVETMSILSCSYRLQSTKSLSAHANKLKRFLINVELPLSLQYTIFKFRLFSKT